MLRYVLHVSHYSILPRLVCRTANIRAKSCFSTCALLYLCCSQQTIIASICLIFLPLYVLSSNTVGVYFLEDFSGDLEVSKFIHITYIMLADCGVWCELEHAKKHISSHTINCKKMITLRKQRILDALRLQIYVRGYFLV